MKIFGWETGKLSVDTAGFGAPRNAGRDWRILLIVSFVLLVVFAGFSIWTFSQVKAGNFSTASGDTTNDESMTLDREQLNQAVADFQKERATFDLLRDRQPDMSNPAR